jgi:LmbE family N-acetylglucosaminyl deacetylase
MAHPDDAEFLCAGVLALLQGKGWEIHIASMTPGDCGSRTMAPEEIARVRIGEARAAAARIGGQYHCLDGRDLLVCFDPPAIRRTVELVRQIDPAVVITHSPQDYMLDHEFTSMLARTACFAAPAPNFKTGSLPCAPPAARIPHLYYAAPVEGTNLFGESVAVSLIIDISRVIGIKSDMLACHKSQRDWLRAQHGIDEYLEAMRRWSAVMGSRIGVEYGEGFRQHRGHAYPHDDLLGALLGGVAAG